jgi:hypothetical protein
MYKTIISSSNNNFHFVKKSDSGSDESDKNEKDKIKTAHWLLGQWEAQSDGGTLTETWKKANDSTYNGQVYFMKGTDTIHTEKILLQQVEDD